MTTTLTTGIIFGVIILVIFDFFYLWNKNSEQRYEIIRLKDEMKRVNEQLDKCEKKLIVEKENEKLLKTENNDLREENYFLKLTR